MYDGTDVALVLGMLLSAGLGGLLLIAALVALGVFLVNRSKGRTAAGGWAPVFGALAVLCGLSIATGLMVYDSFEHRRGFDNPPVNVAAVAAATVWGPVAAPVLAWLWLRRRPRVETSRAVK